IRSLEMTCRNRWAWQLGATAVCFGTMVLPFSISLNNHLPAAAMTATVMWIYLLVAAKLRQEQEMPVRVSSWYGFVAGLASAFTVANELPALSMLVFWGGLFFLLHRSSLLPYCLGALLVVIAFFGTNWIAHQSLRPPYAHRGIGGKIGTITQPADSDAAWLENRIKDLLGQHDLFDDSAPFSIQPSDEPGRRVVMVGEQPFALVPDDDPEAETQDGPSTRWRLAHWDDWYEYPNTHWKKENLKGVDRGEPSRLVYFAHMTIGHHGIFSLTPLWLLMPVGLLINLRSRSPDFRYLTLAILVATVVCAAFYVIRPEIDRNYGGVSVCFRWLLWFVPLWSLMAASALDRFAHRRWFRRAATVMLALSVFSVSTALASPWQHPWLYQFWVFLGWIDPA
ncbi:MAG: hypothetical protein MI861_28295, partial [Pirellulales bacterium]|nr:hypothetical protein [Pirellulales bacterium]